MLPAADNLYFEQRMRWGVVPTLCDEADSPPERLLQAVWQHQRVVRDRLATPGGRKITVLHPGFWNFEGGPDFREALIQIGDEKPIQGDVEVDVHSSGWQAHNHHRNPAFKNVILHVVWEICNRPAAGPPVLALKSVLDSRVGELSLWLGAQDPRELPGQFRGECCSLLKSLPEGEILELLRQAADVRLSAKSSWFESRGRQAGWEQCLWEGLFRALGYKNNAWPMQRVAELRPRWHAERTGILELQARLFGISGMLPSDFSRKDDPYPRKLWDCWWRERDIFSDCILPKEAWKLHGLRPANHPQRRLALASHWSAMDDLPAKLEEWCARNIHKTQLPHSLETLLQCPVDKYWSRHWTFRSARMAQPQPLLGRTRVTDLAVNVILPWLAVRAAGGKQHALLDRVRARYFEWPAAEDNSVLKLARQRIFGTSSKALFATAAAQQGLIQIVRDFCDQKNSACDDCKLPEMIIAGVLSNHPHAT